MIRFAILFKILSCLLLALHASLSKLFHHLKKFLPIILEKVVGNGENITCEYRVEWHVSGAHDGEVTKICPRTGNG
jgi:hypothetical protein